MSLFSILQIGGSGQNESLYLAPHKGKIGRWADLTEPGIVFSSDVSRVFPHVLCKAMDVVCAWLRNDLRVHDNPVLHEAGYEGEQVCNCLARFKKEPSHSRPRVLVPGLGFPILAVERETMVNVGWLHQRHLARSMCISLTLLPGPG